MEKRSDGKAGFTLIELLIVLLIVAILASTALPVYVGYTRDAKLAEAKALAGLAFTAVQACVQAKVKSCEVSDVTLRIGLDDTGLTGDARWRVDPKASLQLNIGTIRWEGGPIQVAGQRAKDNLDLKTRIKIDSGVPSVECDYGENAFAPC